MPELSPRGATLSMQTKRAYWLRAALCPDAQARRAETKRRHDAAGAAWQPSSLPAWVCKRRSHARCQPPFRASSRGWRILDLLSCSGSSQTLMAPVSCLPTTGIAVQEQPLFEVYNSRQSQVLNLEGQVMKRGDKVRVKNMTATNVENSLRGRMGTVVADSKPGEVILVEFDGEAVTHQFLIDDLEQPNDDKDEVAY